MPRRTDATASPSISDTAVHAATGHTWDAWIAILNDAGARELPHKNIASLLRAQFGLSSWWSQMVTVGYEQRIGRRVPTQRATGFAAGVARTLPAGIDAVYACWTSARTRTRWFPRTGYTLSSEAPGRNARLRAADGSRVTVSFTARAADKCTVMIEQQGLPDANAVSDAKARWREAIERLAALL